MTSRRGESTGRLRSTRQRAAIDGALAGAQGFLTAQEIHDRVRRAGHRVGLTTVYRTLQRLSEAGEVDVLAKADGEAMYRRCVLPDHHHHLVCRRCRRSVEIEADEVEAWAARTARHHGFTAASHTIEMFGVCEQCSGDAV